MPSGARWTLTRCGCEQGVGSQIVGDLGIVARRHVVTWRSSGPRTRLRWAIEGALDNMSWRTRTEAVAELAQRATTVTP